VIEALTSTHYAHSLVPTVRQIYYFL